MPAVVAESVEFHHGTQLALGRSSFTIPTGAITTLIGPNGSGKSTLLHAIAGLTAPSSGSLVVATDTGTPKMALVLQTTKVNAALPITVREIVSMGRYPGLSSVQRLSKDDRDIVDAALAKMSIEELSGRHLSELSGGQRQRVFVAQGLAQDHEILLLDEPMTGLDLPSAQAIDDVIHEEHALGGTIIMTTHDLAEARASDHVVLLAGQVIASGPPREVLTAEHLRAAYGTTHLHVDGDDVFLDDPAHAETSEHHVHQDRSIHVEARHEDGSR